MKKCKSLSARLSVFVSFIALLGLVHPAFAHFGMVIPSDTMVMQDDERKVDVTLSFSHPFETVGMELLKPKVFDVTLCAA